MGELWHTRLEKLRNYWEFLLKLSRLAYFDMRPVVIRSQDIPQGKGDWNRIRELLEQIELLLFDKNVHKLELAVHELFIKEVKPSFNFDLGYAVINDLNRLTMKLKDQLNLTQSSASLLFHLDRYFPHRKGPLRGETPVKWTAGGAFAPLKGHMNVPSPVSGLSHIFQSGGSYECTWYQQGHRGWSSG